MKTFNSIVLITSVVVGTFSVSAQAATHQGMQHSQAELRAMDTSKDNMVSKDEFLAYHTQMFNKMKLTNGMISLKGTAELMDTPAKTPGKKPVNAPGNAPADDMHAIGDDASSMNNKPIGTTTDNPTVNDKDAVNGKSY